MAAVRFFPHERSPSAGEASRHSLSINIRYSQNLSLECVGPPLNKSSCGAVNERAAAFCPSTQRSHCVKSKTSLLPAAGGRQGGRAAKVVLLIQHRHIVSVLTTPITAICSLSVWRWHAWTQLWQFFAAPESNKEATRRRHTITNDII